MNDFTRISEHSTIIIEGNFETTAEQFLNRAKEELERLYLLEVSIIYEGCIMETTEETTLEEVKEFLLHIQANH